LLILSAASFGAVRASGLLAMAMAPGLIVLALKVVGRLALRLGSGGASVLLCGLAVLLFGMRLASLPGAFGIGTRDAGFPVAAGIVKQRHLDGGNIFNYASYGSGLAWQLGPTWKVVMDGHFTKNYSTAFDHYDRIMQMSDGWAQALDDYHVNLAVVPPVLPVFVFIPKLSYTLLESDDWVLAGREPSGALVFTRRNRGESKDRNAEGLLFWATAYQSARLMALETSAQNVQQANTTAEFAMMKWRAIKASMVPDGIATAARKK
jgi:hypothetical protein